MDDRINDITIPSMVAAMLLILTAVGSAEAMMAVSVTMLLAMLLLHRRFGAGPIWPKLLICLAAAGLAAAIVLILRR